MATHHSRLGTAIAVCVLVATACSSGSKGPSTAPTSSIAASPACAARATAGASGGADVLVPGDIPDNQAYVVYRSSAGGYHVSVPEGWARSESGGTATFRTTFSSIRVQLASVASPPSVAAVQAGEMPGLAGSVPCFEPGKVSQVSRSSGVAVLATYRADSPADAVTGKIVRLDVERYEFWQAGKEAVVTLSSPQGSDNVDPWRKVTDSFGWGP